MTEECPLREIVCNRDCCKWYDLITEECEVSCIKSDLDSIADSLHEIATALKGGAE